MKEVTDSTRESASSTLCMLSTTLRVSSSPELESRVISIAKKFLSALGIICTVRRENISTPRATAATPPSRVSLGWRKLQP